MRSRPPPSRPGLHASPAAGFDQPFELLNACHDRVRQRLELLERLLAHLDRHSVDAQAEGAAQDLLRYFDIAAPLHHEDEERHLVPRLLASGNPALQAAARQLLAEHAQIRAAWQVLRALLAHLAEAEHSALHQAARHFIALHGPHLRLEDHCVYPAARLRTPATEQAAMGREMAGRRGATPSTPP